MKPHLILSLLLFSTCLLTSVLPVSALSTDDPILSLPYCGLKYNLPSNPNGAAVIIIPGGGYCFLANEAGIPVTRLLQNGYTAIELSYDVYKNYYGAGVSPTGEEEGLYPVPMVQIDRAVRRVRRDASLHGIDPNKIGVMGFSAGGHVASFIATHFEPGDKMASPSSEMHHSSRPDFQILGYPLITMEDSRYPSALLGRHSKEEDLIHYLSNEYQTTPATPKAYVSHGTSDTVVDIQKSYDYVAALETNGVSVACSWVPQNHGGFGWDMTAFMDRVMPWLNEKVLAPCSHAAYGATAYTWKGCTTCTASRVCTSCGDTVWEVATVASEVTTEPTRTTTGVRTYTATYADSTFTTQTKTETIPVAEHDWLAVNSGYEWIQTADGWICTASNTCTCSGAGCPAATNETVTATYALVTPATVAAAGLGRHTATFVGSMFATQTKDIVIPNRQPPRFGGDIYVSPNGSDYLYDGTSPDTPFWTIAHAVEVATDGQTICVLSGLNEVAKSISVTKALTIIGETGNPADVIVRNVTSPTTSAPGPYRVFEINNAHAVLSGMAVEGGKMGGVDKQGGNIVIDSNGGTVTNCIIRNATMHAYDAVGNAKTGANGAGIASLSANGLITHCVITNNFFTRGPKSAVGNAGGGAGVYLQNGKLLQSLIAFNTVSNDANCAAVSIANASLMENCSVVANCGGGDAGNFSPVVPAYASQTPLIRNTLIYGNVGFAGGTKLFADGWVAANSAKMANVGSRFVNCATDATLPSGYTASFNMITTGIAVSSDFRPFGTSSTVDAGAEMTSPASFDLAGNPRISGTAVDIGCYEFDSEGGPHEHAYGPPSYIWIGFTACTASCSCWLGDSTISEAATDISVVTNSPTCTAAGSCTYTATFTDELFSTQTKTETILAAGHDWLADNSTYVWIETAGGWDCVASNVCTVADCDAVTNETVTAAYAVVTPATAQGEGRGLYTATFSGMMFTPQTKEVAIPAIDHDHGWLVANSTYVWTETVEGWACIATSICANENCDVSTNETVTARCEIVEQATAVQPGLGRYTATFVGEMFVEQTKEVVIPAQTVIVGDYYVSTTGSDANAGLTRETAFATISKAVTEATAGQSICVLAGTYEITTAIAVAKALTIIGETGDPADVIVRNTAAPANMAWLPSQGAYRVFEINNANAVLSGIAVEGGLTGGAGDYQGGNILINSNGGTVTNCIIRNARMYGIAGNGAAKNGTSGAGIACLSASGLVTHCVITNNFMTRGNGGVAANPWQWGGAAGVHLQNGGTLRQSLIASNTSTNDNFASVVLLGNAAGILMENCTVAENRGLGTVGNFYPVMYYAQYASTSPTVRNTLICRNTGFGGNKELLNDVWDASAIGSLADVKFYNCATDSTLPTGFPAGLNMITTGIALTSGFRPSSTSSIIDAGASMTSPVGLDLAGNPRIVGEAVDIGCYEFYTTTSPAETATTPEPVPYSWLVENGLATTSTSEAGRESAALANAANGRPVWACYVAGLDPNAAASQFTATIDLVDGVPEVTWTPDLSDDGRTYEVVGKASLSDAAWAPTNASHRFFQVRVNLAK